MTSAADERRALAELLLHEQLAAERARSGVHPRQDPRKPVPLSPSQLRIWLAEQLTPGVGAYNELVAIRLRGPFLPDRIDRCVAAVVERHEALRTAIVLADDGPVQTPVSDVSADVRVESLLQLPAGAREFAAGELVREAAERPFDLARPPLLRVRVIRLADDEHVLAVVTHHIVSDGWSIRIVLEELTTEYAGGNTVAPTIQYADYALWQVTRLGRGELDGQLDYWRRQLDGAPRALELPTDHPRPAVPTYRGDEQTFDLPPTTVTALTRLARGENATLFMVLLAAFQVVLARHARQDDIVIGTPVAGRPRTETEQVVGCFINTLALRTSLAGAPTFRELLGRVRTVVLEAFEHQEIPFERIVEHSRQLPDASRNPVFQVMCVLHNMPLELRGLPDARAEVITGLGRHAKLDLTLGFVEHRGGLTGHLEYSTDLFEPATIARLAGHLTTVLDGIVADPDRAIGDLPLLTEKERSALLTEWSTPIVHSGPDRRVHEMFADQVRRTPEAVAIVDGDRHISYADLDGRANRLATWLHALGARRGTLVALCLPRCAEQVVAMLGVLKAGAAYIPIDPDDPIERMRTVLDDSDAQFLVTTDAFTERLSWAPARVLAIESVPRDNGSPPPRSGDPADLAYVLYTSGSTGKPKGVQIEHRNVTRLFQEVRDLYEIGAEDSWVMFHHYGFDVSVWEVFGALLHGGRLVIVPYSVSRSPTELHKLLAAEKVTVLSQTPTAFAGLIAADKDAPERLDHLRLVVLGGERLDFRLLAPWLERYSRGAPSVVNMFGPTETTIWATRRPVTGTDTRSARSFIGTALPHARLLVVDPELRPVPVGFAGELLIAGPLVGRGYLDRPELDATTFVTDPYVPGRRCYRSGDLVRRTGNDDLEFLGRIDDQVKVRGFRIELGEIEVALRAHPDVTDAIAAVREDATGATTLGAYVVSTSVPRPAPRDLRAFLGSCLPSHMIPSGFAFLDRVPTTVSGKADRQALPPISTITGDTDRAYRAAPRNATEAVLAERWAGLLGVEQISVDDNVFELGAHSVMAVRLHRAVRGTVPEFNVIDIFQYPTVRGLAEHVLGKTSTTTQLDEARDRAVRRRQARRRHRPQRNQAKEDQP
ncbi:non-ribosomal peptide synthetase [Amycolatopsis magusensis]|uniref:Amino acid adenylation domain-containing protein n=1 Tax=Amycolatopsis magusensis TaxID=882444 RepID=A0ABS4PU46_9PSEU|nr:non-ribosomal peptide synthetase [Amycolatopsis magusensis]MBP2182946.1 amino acid adenylation domain-containing protein [Amycolatopsis magusensis]